jgi:hypothetical protein
MKIKDSGSRSKFESGAQRDCQEGKGRMDLLPFMALMNVARVYEEGAKKYRAHNWRRGIPLSRYADSGMRHFAKWMAGMRDEPHLDQAVWNLLCLIETQELIRQGKLPAELNDLPYNPLDILENPQDLPDLELPFEGSELDGDVPGSGGELYVDGEKLCDVESFAIEYTSPECRETYDSTEEETERGTPYNGECAGGFCGAPVTFEIRDADKYRSAEFEKYREAMLDWGRKEHQRACDETMAEWARTRG